MRDSVPGAGRQPESAVRRVTMTVDEAAAYLGISRQTAYAEARAGRLPVLRIGRRILIVRKALDAMLAEVTPTRQIDR